MDEEKETLKINVNVEITPGSLQEVVRNFKSLADKEKKRAYRMDTADLLSEMISKFLLEKDFEGYVSETDNYKNLANLEKD